MVVGKPTGHSAPLKVFHGLVGDGDGGGWDFGWVFLWFCFRLLFFFYSRLNLFLKVLFPLEIWPLVPSHMFNEITNIWTWNSSPNYFSSIVPTGGRQPQLPLLLLAWFTRLVKYPAPQSAWVNDFSDWGKSHVPLQRCILFYFPNWSAVVH